MAYPGENGRNLVHLDNQLGHVVRSFPSPALNGGQVSRESPPLHANQAGAPLVLQGYGMNQEQLQHFSGSVRGKSIWDTLVPWPIQHHEYALGWPMVQQAPLPCVVRYPAPCHAVAPNDHIVWGMPMPPQDAHFLPRPTTAAPPSHLGTAGNVLPPLATLGRHGITPPPPSSYGAAGYGGASTPLHGAQAQSHLAPVPDKSLEQFLEELGVLEDAPTYGVYNGGNEDVDLDALLFGPSLGQLGLVPVRSSPEASGSRSHRSTAAEAREQRIRRMAKKKEAAARARAKKLAATRGNLEGSKN